MSTEEIGNLREWVEEQFELIREQLAIAEEKIEAKEKFDKVSREAVMRFCDALEIDDDDGLDSVLRDIEAFDDGLEESWEELQQLREKDENMRENLGDVLERVDTASGMLNDLRRDL